MNAFTENTGVLRQTKKGSTSNGQKTLADVQHRQKIFEEEIIKRIKEIQRYVKNLHLQLKKTQNENSKMRDEIDNDKDILIELQSTVDNHYKKYSQERLKQVTSAELESKFKDQEFNFNVKIVQVLQEATDQTLAKVRDELIPSSRLKMYDSITEEQNRLKIEIDHQLQVFKRDLQDANKQAREKSQELFSGEAKTLRSELMTEQSAQKLQLMS